MSDPDGSPPGLRVPMPDVPDVPEKLRSLLEMFSMMEDRQARIDALIDLADTFEPVPHRIAAPPYPESARVPSCESQAFAFVEPTGAGALRYHFAVENPQGVSAMAMAAIIDQTLSGEDPLLVRNTPTDIIYALFGRELSMGKSAGLMGMVQMVRALTARAMSQPGANVAPPPTAQKAGQ